MGHEAPPRTAEKMAIEEEVEHGEPSAKVEERRSEASAEVKERGREASAEEEERKKETSKGVETRPAVSPQGGTSLEEKRPGSFEGVEGGEPEKADEPGLKLKEGEKNDVDNVNNEKMDMGDIEEVILPDYYDNVSGESEGECGSFEELEKNRKRPRGRRDPEKGNAKKYGK